MKDVEQMIVCIRSMIPRAESESEREYLSDLANRGESSLKMLQHARFPAGFKNT